MFNLFYFCQSPVSNLIASMNILFLTQIIPFPPDAGPKVKTWQVLRFLSGTGRNVVLASFIRPEEETYVDELRKICSSVYTVPIRRSRIADVGYWVMSNFTGRPFLIERDDFAAMRELVHTLIVEHSIDVIHADQLTMTQFALPYSLEYKGENKNSGRSEIKTKTDRNRPVLIFDAHNAVWTIVDRMVENAPFIIKQVLMLEAHRIKRYEAMVTDKFDLTLAVAKPDRIALINALRDHPNLGDRQESKIHVIPIAVDTTQIKPITRKQELIKYRHTGHVTLPAKC